MELIMRAILIDDSRAMRMILKRTLTEMGFQCIEAGDGREALELLKASAAPPDLALVDWNMPNMDGYEFVCAIRTDPVYQSMKIMMVTTEVEMEQVSKALAAGADEYVMKPFSSDVIRDKINYLGFERAAA